MNELDRLFEAIWMTLQDWPGDRATLAYEFDKHRKKAKAELSALIAKARKQALIEELEMWDAAQKAGATHRSSLAYRIKELKDGDE